MKNLEKVRLTWTEASLRIVQFCDDNIISDMETHAMTMRRYKGKFEQSWTATLISMEEVDILRIIYDSVKATSTYKLVTSFEINKANWPQFLRAASMYTKDFLEYLQAMGKRTHSSFIPPLYKTKGIKGLVTYYCEGFTKRVGTSLYESELNECEELGCQKTLRAVSTLFLTRLYARKMPT